MPSRQSAAQLDLLGWQPPEPVVRFDDIAVRSASLNGRIAKAIAASLVGQDRGEVAEAMTRYLGRPVSKNMIDGYASCAREDHVISTPRFMALLATTGDRRLLQLFADPNGWGVVERKDLLLIQAGAIREREGELRRHRTALQRQIRLSGV